MDRITKTTVKVNVKDFPVGKKLTMLIWFNEVVYLTGVNEFLKVLLYKNTIFQDKYILSGDYEIVTSIHTFISDKPVSYEFNKFYIIEDNSNVINLPITPEPSKIITKISFTVNIEEYSGFNKIRMGIYFSDILTKLEILSTLKVFKTKGFQIYSKYISTGSYESLVVSQISSNEKPSIYPFDTYFIYGEKDIPTENITDRFENFITNSYTEPVEILEQPKKIDLNKINLYDYDLEDLNQLSKNITIEKFKRKYSLSDPEYEFYSKNKTLIEIKPNKIKNLFKICTGDIYKLKKIVIREKLVEKFNYK
jgi:hypothetical protein